MRCHNLKPIFPLSQKVKKNTLQSKPNTSPVGLSYDNRLVMLGAYIMGKLISYNSGDMVGPCIYLADEPFRVLGGERKRFAKFRCVCGNEYVANLSDNSHGCAAKNNVTDEYKIWSGMKSRCLIPSASGYKYYGGRGIKVCETWINSFETFLSDMGPRPSCDHSIERIDSNGNYEKSNCKWATDIEQAANKRNNTYFIYKNEKVTLRILSDRFGFTYEVLKSRICRYKWSIEKAVTTPLPERFKRTLNS